MHVSLGKLKTPYYFLAQMDTQQSDGPSHFSIYGTWANSPKEQINLTDTNITLK